MYIPPPPPLVQCIKTPVNIQFPYSGTMYKTPVNLQSLSPPHLPNNNNNKAKRKTQQTNKNKQTNKTKTKNGKGDHRETAIRELIRCDLHLSANWFILISLDFGWLHLEFCYWTRKQRCIFHQLAASATPQTPPPPPPPPRQHRLAFEGQCGTWLSNHNAGERVTLYARCN